MSSKRLGLAALILCALPGTPLFAQSTSAEATQEQLRSLEQLSPKDRREAKRLLESNDRDALYPSHLDRFKISGLAQGDNDFRARTPALQNSDMVSAQVDTDALRERLLSIYASDTKLSTPVPLASRGGYAYPSMAESPGPAGVEEAVPEPLEQEESDRMGWLIGLPLSALVLIWGLRKLLSN